jgi:hypothetical protein
LVDVGAEIDAFGWEIRRAADDCGLREGGEASDAANEGGDFVF